MLFVFFSPFSLEKIKGRKILFNCSLIHLIDQLKYIYIVEIETREGKFSVTYLRNYRYRYRNINYKIIHEGKYIHKKQLKNNDYIN